MQASAVENAQRDDSTLTSVDLIAAYEKGVEELRLAVAGMTGEQLRWLRTAVHSETDLVTLRQLLLHAISHLRHHLRFVAEKRAAMGVS